MTNEFITRTIIQIESQMLQSLYRLSGTLQLLTHLGEPCGMPHISNTIIGSNHLRRARPVMGDAQRLDTLKEKLIYCVFVSHGQKVIALRQYLQRVARSTSRWR